MGRLIYFSFRFRSTQHLPVRFGSVRFQFGSILCGASWNRTGTGSSDEEPTRTSSELVPTGSRDSMEGTISASVGPVTVLFAFKYSSESTRNYNKDRFTSEPVRTGSGSNQDCQICCTMRRSPLTAVESAKWDQSGWRRCHKAFSRCSLSYSVASFGALTDQSQTMPILLET
jgi:hypothetical protein